jgi:hypothetical protein
MTLAPCPTHGSNFRALHEHNFRGIVEVIEQLLVTVSGVGTTSYSKCALGYPWNFEGVVRALEDLNTTISGIQGGGTAIQAGSGIYLTASGDVTVVNTSANTVQAGSGIFFTSSGTAVVINATITSASGAIFTAGSGLYLVNGTQFNVNYDNVFQNSVSGHIFGAGDNTVTYSGNTVTISGSGVAGGGASVTVSGSPKIGYSAGDLWFDTNEGRLFVYASGNGVTNPAWYQTNAEAIVNKGEVPPSGTGLNAPQRDGSLWFNTLMGNLFVYDATTSGWYETGPSRSFAYGPAAPAPSVQGAGWLDSSVNRLKVWNGSTWADIDIDGGVY